MITVNNHGKVHKAWPAKSQLQRVEDEGECIIHTAMQDHEAVLEYLTQRGDGSAALSLLRTPAVSQELFYKFAPALMALDPHATVRPPVPSSYTFLCRPISPGWLRQM
jgi:hypothetical protein